MCAQVGHQEDANPSRDGKAPTLAQWRDKYKELRANELADETMYLHTLTFRYLCEHFGEGVRIDRLTRASAAEWRAGLDLGEQSTCLHVRNAKVIFGKAVDLDILTTNPFDRENGTPAAVDKEWAEIGPADMEKILAECPNDGWRALFGLCRWAGTRRGEALRVKWADVDLAASVLRVVNEGAQTTKKRSRTVPLSPRLHKLLQAIFDAAPTGAVRPTEDVAEGNLSHQADAILTRAGFAYAKPFHTLRKNLETEWMAVYPVLDVASWLGHSPTVAAKHYVRTTPETLARVTGRTVPGSSQTDQVGRAASETAL